jgi:hypothetical protein
VTFFFKEYAAVLEPLAVVSELTRTTKQLTEEQMVDLKQACEDFGDAYRESYEKLLTPKVHIIEVHVWPIVRRLNGWCGCTGEDGLEALHPWDTRCRLITRAMRDPVARLQATHTHLHAQHFAVRTPSKKRKAPTSAPADGGGGGGLSGGGMGGGDDGGSGDDDGRADEDGLD